RQVVGLAGVFGEQLLQGVLFGLVFAVATKEAPRRRRQVAEIHLGHVVKERDRQELPAIEVGDCVADEERQHEDTKGMLGDALRIRDPTLKPASPWQQLERSNLAIERQQRVGDRFVHACFRYRLGRAYYRTLGESSQTDGLPKQM